MEARQRLLYVVVSVSLAGLFLAGAGMSDPTALPAELLRILTHPGRLISDFAAIGGPGAALINGALVGFLGLLLIRVNAVSLSGPTVAAVLTMTGFGFFGKTPLNILPIMLGVYFLCRLMHKPFRTYILIALYGTALGPLVSFLAFEAGFQGPAAAAAALVFGTGAGLLLPPLAIAMLKWHQGYNLYNLGLTCGFLGLFVAALVRGWGGSLAIEVAWHTGDQAALSRVLLAFSIYYLACGLVLGGRGVWREMKTLFGESGRLPTDFLDLVSTPAVLVNMGVLGLVSWLYILVVRGAFNGPSLGGAFTVIGFAAFGKHLKNIAPVMAGALAGCLLFGLNPAEPGPLLAALFVTTLAPIAGDFGPVIGFAAGFVHLALVQHTAAWHGGMDLYNNGFAGGLTATLTVALMEWHRAHYDEFRPQRKENTD